MPNLPPPLLDILEVKGFVVLEDIWDFTEDGNITLKGWASSLRNGGSRDMPAGWYKELVQLTTAFPIAPIIPPPLPPAETLHLG